MKRFLAFLLPLAIPISLFAQSKSSPDKKVVVVTHVTVIDATGAPPKPDMTVVITGERITRIGPARKIRPPKGARRVAATGKFLIPGLWDMHVHALRKGRVDTFFPLFVANGITGIRDMGVPLDDFNLFIKQWRPELSSGRRTGPRVAAAGTIIDGIPKVWPWSIGVSNATEARQAVNTVLQSGADFIKVYNVLSRESYFAIADEARKRGIPFSGHVPDGISAAEASAAGQRSIEHLYGILLACSTRESELREELRKGELFVDWIRSQCRSADTYSDEKAAALFSQFIRNQTWQCPTMAAEWFDVVRNDSQLMNNDSRMKYVSASTKELWKRLALEEYKDFSPEDAAGAKRLFERNLQLIAAMHRAGVPFLAGTDIPNPYTFPGFSLHDELGWLVKGGFTPMEALQTATLNPARYLGLLDSLGTVEPGKLADLVLVDANPLDDIRNTQKISAVMINGRLLERKALDELLAHAEALAKEPVSTQAK